MDEKRTMQRHPRLKPARIVFNGRSSTMSCTVRNATATGARIKIGEGHMLPSEFEITVSGEVPRRARRIWLKPGEMGIAYLA